VPNTHKRKSVYGYAGEGHDAILQTHRVFLVIGIELVAWARYWDIAMRKGPLLIVGLVFLASLATLVASTTIALWDTTNEFEVRDRLLAAADQLSGAASEAVARLPPDKPGIVLPEAENRQLAAVVRSCLGQFPGAEGGFYLVASDQFVGTLVTSPELETSGPEQGKQGKSEKKADKKKWDKKETPGPTLRRDPPPKETDSIRNQVRLALSQPSGSSPLVEIRDIGPSRVAVATVAVGEERPARVGLWIMVRLTGPEQQKARLGRLQLATGLSLLGILLALGLTIGLGRSLRNETRRQQALRDELAKAEYLASLGRLLAGVAHEVRNPLTAIRSTIQLWERLPESARTPESLAAVVKAVDRLNELVGRLLLFARAGHESRRPIDLNAIVVETLELIRARADAQRIVIETDLEPGLPKIDGSAQALSQVVLNLTSNALQAMPNGGRLICRTQILPAKRIELTISDSGPGVPEEARERIFEPFFTTRADGTGLGLALCRELAHQHGGDVTLDPVSTSGATFRLSLPIASITGSTA
jgi:two-component system sensor histidine kinase HydH